MVTYILLKFHILNFKSFTTHFVYIVDCFCQIVLYCHIIDAVNRLNLCNDVWRPQLVHEGSSDLKAGSSGSLSSLSESMSQLISSDKNECCAHGTQTADWGMLSLFTIIKWKLHHLFCTWPVVSSVLLSVVLNSDLSPSLSLFISLFS